MENLQRIALLIDADNTQLAKLEDVTGNIYTWPYRCKKSVW